MEVTVAEPLRSYEVVVAVLTYARPVQLAALVPELVDQTRRVSRDPRWNTEVLVVDNSPDGSAAGTVRQSRERVRYVHEPIPGIAVARARAISEATAADVLIFIDDDETPTEGWLASLLTAWLEHDQPAGVAGKVTPVYTGQMDPWIAAGGFFVRPRRTTGDLVSAASSANLLLDLAVLRRLGLTFDRQLALGGGEDTLLTTSLTRRGHRIVWCDEAEVIDHIPASRMSRRWVLRRAYHHGAVASGVEMALAKRSRKRTTVRAVGRGMGRVVIGALLALGGYLTLNMRSQARGLRLCCRGAGLMRGLFGQRPSEYAR